MRFLIVNLFIKCLVLFVCAVSTILSRFMFNALNFIFLIASIFAFLYRFIVVFKDLKFSIAHNLGLFRQFEKLLLSFSKISATDGGCRWSTKQSLRMCGTIQYVIAWIIMREYPSPKYLNKLFTGTPEAYISSSFILNFS